MSLPRHPRLSPARAASMQAMTFPGFLNATINQSSRKFIDHSVFPRANVCLSPMPPQEDPPTGAHAIRRRYESGTMLVPLHPMALLICIRVCSRSSQALEWFLALSKPSVHYMPFDWRSFGLCHARTPPLNLSHSRHCAFHQVLSQFFETMGSNSRGQSSAPPNERALMDSAGRGAMISASVVNNVLGHFFALTISALSFSIRVSPTLLV